MPTLSRFTLQELFLMDPLLLSYLAGKLSLLEWSVILCVPAMAVTIVAGLTSQRTTCIVGSLVSIFFLIVCGLAGSRISIGMAGWFLLVLLVNVFPKDEAKAQVK